MPTNKQVIDKLTSLEALLEAGLRECHKARTMIQGDVSTPPAGHVSKTRAEMMVVAKAVASKRIQRIKSKSL